MIKSDGDIRTVEKPGNGLISELILAVLSIYVVLTLLQRGY
jgi:hypothetical protein